MCGIAGFNLHPSSRVNTRELAHNLLSAIETRGSHSSGYAFVKGDDVGVYKNAVPGSQLPLGDLPRRAQTVILHTRFATQGSQRDNRNNHPVISPNGSIALVHNGVISNDYLFRERLGGEFEGLPAVDTAVIPALIEKYGFEATVPKLEGYAAVAYLDLESKDSDILNLARLDYSPVAFTWLEDGSFVFASTEILLVGALELSGLEYGHIWTMPEETHMAIRNGVILSVTDGHKMQEDWYTRRQWSSATAGGHTTTPTGTVGSEVTTNVYGIGSSFGNIETGDEDNLSYDEDRAIRDGEYRKVENEDGTTSYYWDNDYRNTKNQVTFDPDEAMAFANETNEPAGTWVAGPDGALVRLEDDDDLKGFYVEMDDSSIETQASLEELEKFLGWIANMTLGNDVPFPGVEPKLKWTNFVRDIGHISVRDGMVSWLEDLANIDKFENPSVYNLEYIREGAVMLIMAED